MLKFFTENKLMAFYQSGFKPGDFCVSQLLYISHGIYQSIILW